MKLRMDYVSNSSSCSFFIHLKTKESVDAFKEILPKLQEMKVIYPGYYSSLKSLSEWVHHVDHCGDPFFICNTKDWYSELSPGCVVIIGTEEDDLRSMATFDEALELVEANPVNFELYQDDLAHQTAGKRVPKPRSIK